jgi:hypothetical protein
MDTADMLRRIHALKEYRTALEEQLELEGIAESDEGYRVTEIRVMPVETGHQIVTMEEADLVRWLREHKMIAECWRWATGKAPPDSAPRLVSDVTDADTGEPLEPHTLTPLSQSVPPPVDEAPDAA